MTKKTQPSLYMHTINGRPAMYMPGIQIVTFPSKWSKINFDDIFVTSLDRIKQEQHMSKAWRRREGYEGNLPDGYGYIRIKDNRGKR